MEKYTIKLFVEVDAEKYFDLTHEDIEDKLAEIFVGQKDLCFVVKKIETEMR